MGKLINFLSDNTNNVLGSIIIAVTAIIVWACISRAFKRNQKKYDGTKGRNTTYMHFLYNAIKYTIIVVAILGILRVNDINVSSILAGVGILSAVIGLALQDELKDAIMGFHFLTDDFFQVGDFVEYKGEKGVVISYNLKYVRLESLSDNSIISICNRNIMEIKKCSNQLLVDIPLSYEDDFEIIRELMLKCCEELRQNELVISCDYLGTQSFDESSIAYRTKIECSPKDAPKVRRAFLAIVQRQLKENGLEIPYSKLQVISC